MTKNKAKHTLKDSVFTDLFQDKKYMLALYKTLHPEDVNVSEDEIINVTLKHILINGDYNDLGFMVGDRLLISVESQYTWSDNIIARGLLYCLYTYDNYLKATKQNLYSSKRITMPKPELYVIYVGERKDVPDTISLSENYFGGEKLSIDAEVKILYHEDNIIGQYTIFSKVYSEQRKRYGNTKAAVSETIRICKDRNVLKAYLESREQEVMDIMMMLYDDDWIKEVYEKEIADNAAREAMRKADIAAAKDKIATATETAKRLIQIGKMSLEEIAVCVPALTLDELRELEAQVIK